MPDYELLRSVGSGAYGDVWLARSLTGVYRAVKIVWRSRFSDPHPYEREFSGLRGFARVSITETRQLALLHVGRNDAAGFFYYVMELADDVETGPAIDPERYEPLTLTRYREKTRRLRVRQIVTHAVELARALASLHDHGLVHRDIKPSNIVIVNGQPKLADIGLVTTAASAVTYVGTEGFVPPEGPGTPAADVYSMGKVLYELAMGRDRNDYPRLPEDLHERSDRKELMELNEVILRACDPSPATRYPTAEALLGELLLLQAGKSVRRLRLTERGLARARRGAVVLMVLALMAAGGMAIERQRAERESVGRRAAEAERDLLQRQTVYSAILARAQRAIHMGELGRARKILQEAVPTPGEEDQDLRGWEWHVLQNEARGDSTAVIMEGPHAIERVVHSADGRFLAVLDATKTVTILDATSYERRSTVSGVHRLAGFSPDGEWLLGTTSAYALQAWNHTTGATLGDAQSSGVNRPLAVLPDAPMHLLVFTDGTVENPPVVRAWDLAEQREVYRIPVGEPGGPLWEFFLGAVSANGKRAALAVINGRRDEARFREIAIDLVFQQIVREWPVTTRPTALALSDDGEWLARVAGNTAKVQVFEFTEGHPAWETSLGTSEIFALMFSPCETILLAGTFIGQLHVLNTTSGNLESTLSGQTGTIGSMSWRSTVQELVTTGTGGDVRTWRRPFQSRTSYIDKLWTPVLWKVASSRDGQLIAASLDRDSVGVFQTRTLERIATLSGAKQPIAFTSDGAELITLDQNGMIFWWKIDEQQPYDSMDLRLRPGSTVDAQFAHTSGILISASSDGFVQFWDLARRELRGSTSAHEGNVKLWAPTPNGLSVTTSGQDGRFCVWDVPTGTMRFRLQLQGAIISSAISDDLRTAAVVFGTGTLALVDIDRQRLDREISLGSAAVATRFLRGDSRLVCASRSGLLHVLEANGREIVALEDGVTLTTGDLSTATMDVSENGSLLLTLSRSGRLRTWRTEID